MLKGKSEKTPKRKTVKKKSSAPSPKKKTAARRPVSKDSQKAAKKGKEFNFFEGIGRRKTSSARVRIFPDAEKKIIINGKNFEDYFPTLETKEIAVSPLKEADLLGKIGVSANVKGGGPHSQSEAVRHGLAKAVSIFNPELKKEMKKRGFLTRDSRMRERKKPGLKRARRAPQWKKR